MLTAISTSKVDLFATPKKLERIEKLAIPPAWKEVRISPSPKAKLQATGRDKTGRKQYLFLRSRASIARSRRSSALLRSWRIRQAQVAA